MRTERNKYDNSFNQELKDAKEKEDKHSRKSSNEEQQET
jgi:hypothetical protein